VKAAICAVRLPVLTTLSDLTMFVGAIMATQRLLRVQEIAGACRKKHPATN
jgi:hypothetical protein